MNNKHLKSRPRDGRVCLLRHASLVMMRCEALRTKYRQKRLLSCCGLGKAPMVNDREPSINPVRPQRRNSSDTSHADSRRCLNITVFPSVVQLGDRGYLRELYNVNHAEHGKSDELHEYRGIPTVRKGDGSAGRGTKKKRMPSCNWADRVS